MNTPIINVLYLTERDHAYCDIVTSNAAQRAVLNSLVTCNEKGKQIWVYPQLPKRDNFDTELIRNQMHA